jgi:hypothetical protein
MEPEFGVYDVYRRWVTCDKDIWIRHIWSGHGSAAIDKALAMRALTQPEEGFPRISRQNPMRRIYYLKAPTADYYMKLVVEFRDIDGMQIGAVVTGYNPDYIDDRDLPEPKP